MDDDGCSDSQFKPVVINVGMLTMTLWNPTLFMLALLVLMPGVGCASKRQATQPIGMSPPTSGDNVIVSGMQGAGRSLQGAGRSIVQGSKKGLKSASDGIQKWLDPASAEETASSVDKGSKAASIASDRQAMGPKTKVTGHQDDDTPTQTARADSLDDPASNTKRPTLSKTSSSTRIGSRAVGTNVADSFVIE